MINPIYEENTFNENYVSRQIEELKGKWNHNKYEILMLYLLRFQLSGSDYERMASQRYRIDLGSVKIRHLYGK